MSAQVVMQQPKHSSLQSSPKPAPDSPSKSKSAGHRSPSVPPSLGAARFSATRFRPPRKPEIQVNKNELKQKLTPLQYKVTQEKFTERAFTGEYVRLNENGIYCCVVCGEELFSSQTKYDSGCGWPAFYDTLDPEKLILQTDLSHVGGNLLLLALNQDLARTEVTCAKCGSHLGHVFDDGPRPTGKRYCLNSASLKFRKANGEEVICDIPATNGGSCCLMPSSLMAAARKPVDTGGKLPPPPPAVKIESKESLTKAIQCLKPVGGAGLNSTNKPSSSSPSSSSSSSLLLASREEITTGVIEPNPSNNQHSSHARRTQMNRENFFKASPSTTTRNTTAKNSFMNQPEIIEKQRNRQSPATSATALLNRTKKPMDEATAAPSLKPDWNNNNQPRFSPAVPGKFNDVKSRYLNHLDTISRNQVKKHTAAFGPKKLASNTFPASSSSTTAAQNHSSVLESDL